MDATLGIFRDAAWSFVGVVLAVAAVWLAYAHRKVMAVEYILEEKRLIGLDDDLEGSLQLLFEGKPKQNIWTISARFAHTGTTPIPPSAVERPLTVQLRTAALLNCYATKTEPKELRVLICKSDIAACVTPMTLNPGDRFSLEILASDYEPGSMQLDYRIAGLSKLVRVRKFAIPNKQFLVRGVGAFVMMALAILCGFTLLKGLETLGLRTALVNVVLGSMASGISLGFFALLLYTKVMDLQIFRRWSKQ